MRLSGSLTVEASFVLPLVILFTVLFFRFFTLQVMQTKMQAALALAGQEAAVSYAAFDQKEAAVLSLLSDVCHLLSENGFPMENVEGGENGLSFSRTRYEADRNLLLLHVSYRVKFPFYSFIGMSFPVYQKTAHRVWTGEPITDHILTTRVYVTETGTVYHTFADCPHIYRTVFTVAKAELPYRKNNDGQSYTPCELCAEDGVTGNTVFVTGSGERYHTLKNCSALKRMVSAIPYTDIGTRTLCRKCAERKSE